MITKSDFLKVHQCPRYLWLYKNRKDLIPTEVDPFSQHIFDQGYQIEDYALKLFPKAINAQSEKENDFPGDIQKTKDLLDQDNKVLFSIVPKLCLGMFFMKKNLDYCLEKYLLIEFGVWGW